MKRNRFTDFILSLEEEMTIGKFSVQKKYIFIGILGTIIYVLISIYNTNSAKIANIGEKRGAGHKEEIVNEQKNLAKQEMRPFVEKPEVHKTYEQSLNEILATPNEEIKELLKEQNMFLSDEEIIRFKEEIRMNMPKTEEEMLRQAEEFKRLEEETMKRDHEEAKKMTENQKNIK